MSVSYTNRMLKTALLIMSLSLLVSACSSPPDPYEETLQSYSTASPEAKLPNSNALPNSVQNQNTNQNQQPVKLAPQAQQKGTVKTLSDFEEIKASQATIKTTKGDITFTLFQDKAPLTTANFLNLAKNGFYNGIVFHRVIPDFMAQVGDPLTKDASQKAAWGSGGPGYTINDEFGPGLIHDSEGTVSMANAGPNTGGSQFFITYGPTPWLDGKHAVFGKVTKGMDVLQQITVGDSIISISYQ